MGSFGFGYRAGPCFLAVKSMKNPVFFAREKNSKKTIKYVLENYFFRVQNSLNHAWKWNWCTQEKSNISLSKRFRFDEIKKKINQESVFITSKKFEKVPVKKYYGPKKSEKFS